MCVCVIPPIFWTPVYINTFLVHVGESAGVGHTGGYRSGQHSRVPSIPHLWVYSPHNRRQVGRKRRSERDDLPRRRVLELQRTRVQKGPCEPGALLQPAVPVLVAVNLVSQDGGATVLNGGTARANAKHDMPCQSGAGLKASHTGHNNTFLAAVRVNRK